MKRNSVVLKSNAYGLTLMLDPTIPFEQLLEDAILKFKEAQRFFRNSQMAVTCKGRDLDEEQEYALIRALSEYAGIHVVCLVDEEPEHAEHHKEALMRALSSRTEDQADLYYGTVTNGQKINSDSSLVILGDVNPGGSVSAAGNVIILGCCMGMVSAGVLGKRDAFVAGLVLKPSMLQIADRYARPAITKRVDHGEYGSDPKIGFLKDDHLVVEPLKGNVFRLLKGDNAKICSDNTDSETTGSV